MMYSILIAFFNPEVKSKKPHRLDLRSSIRLYHRLKSIDIITYNMPEAECNK